MNSDALTRRLVLTGVLSLIAAPAIVKASSLMPIKSFIPIFYGNGINDDTKFIQAMFNSELDTKHLIGERNILLIDTIVIPANTSKEIYLRDCFIRCNFPPESDKPAFIVRGSSLIKECSAI